MKDKFENLEKIYSQMDKKQIRPVGNPFAPTQAEKIENDVQIYFNRKYLKINTKIKDIILSVENTKKIVDDAMLDINLAASQYFYDKTFPKNKNYVFEMENDSLKITDDTGVILSLSKFKNAEPYHVTVFKNEKIYEVYYKPSNFLSKIINKTLELKYIEKKDLSGKTIEIIHFSSNKPEKYVSKAKRAELWFDNDPICLKNRSIATKKYVSYDYAFENKIEELDYFYSIPEQYIEYSPLIQKPVKIFKLQGLKNIVHKYFVYSEQNGNLISVHKFL